MTHDPLTIDLAEVCSKCGGRVVRKGAQSCQACRVEGVRERARAQIREWLYSEDPDHKPDTYGRLILEWMANEGLTIKGAARLLGVDPATVRAHALPWRRRGEWVKGRNPSRRAESIAKFAGALGALNARGWDGTRWEQELRAAHPVTSADKIAANWIPGTLVPEHEKGWGSPFTVELRQQVIALNLPRQEVATLAGVTSDVLYSYLNPHVDVRPPLHKLGLLARLWVGKDAPPAKIEHISARLCPIADREGRKPSAAGLLVLRVAAEREYAVTRLIQAGVWPAQIDRLLWEGKASSTTVDRLSKALELPAHEEDDLRRRLKLGPLALGASYASDKRTTGAYAAYEEHWREIEEAGETPSPSKMQRRYGHKVATVRLWLDEREKQRAGNPPGVRVVTHRKK